MKLPVTYLFVPGDRPGRFDKALAAGADVVILDLEDAVAPPAKAQARAHVGAFVAARADVADRLAVRINDRASAWFAADLAMLRDAEVRSAVLPKAESAADVASVRAALSADGRVLPLIETARGVRDVDAVAAAPGVARLAFGTLDFGVDLDLSGDARGLAYAASRIAIASRCAGLPTPIAGVTASLDDEARLVDDLAFARAFGFGAKLCIHPRQVAPVRAAFAPSAAEIEWARRVVDAAAGTQGAVTLDGRMVDRPVVLRAQRILDRTAI
ncbi:MAG: CoA ester lyase [Burkholderiales bacterium]